MDTDVQDLDRVLFGRELIGEKVLVDTGFKLDDSYSFQGANFGFTQERILY